ncbi:hypothetical protein DFJ74DRAFT_772320 [Hyaloraphidium curvatum]|nr:hypothetical protein DFJ74DRAFT_772320 [Hyaloraphidium curvatum]
MDLDAARAAALALPGTVEQPHHHLTSFRVRGKIFSTADPGGAFLRVFLEPARAAEAAQQPGCSEVLWGGKLQGVEMALPIDAGTAEGLLREAWERRAGTRLRRELEPGPARARRAQATGTRTSRTRRTEE